MLFHEIILRTYFFFLLWKKNPSKALSRSIHHKANQQGSGAWFSPHTAALMHRKQLRHVEDLLQIAALTRLGATRTSTPLVVKAPRLPVTAAGGLAFFSVAAVTDIVSHRGRYGPKNNPQRYRCSRFSLQWNKNWAWSGQNKVSYINKSEPVSGGHCQG